MPPSPPPANPEDLARFILPVVLGAAMALSALLRRLDRWLRERRFRQEGRRPGDAQQPPSGTPAPKRPPAEDDEEADDPAAVLMRELERRLLGAEPHRSAAPAAPSGTATPGMPPLPPAVGPAEASRTATGSSGGGVAPVEVPGAGGPSVAPPPSPLLASESSAQTRKSLHRAAEAAQQSPPQPAPAMVAQAAPRRVASVSQRNYAHLALLRSPADLRNAVVLSAILGPPACYRRLGWRFPR